MIRRLFAPALVLVAVFALNFYLVEWKQLDSWASDPRVLRALRILTTLVVVLAWRLRRGRLAWATVSTWLAAEALLWLGSFADATMQSGSAAPKALAVGVAAAVLLPLHLAAAAWLAEWWVVSRAGLVRFGLLAAEVGVLALLASTSGGRHLLASTLEGLRGVIESRWPKLVLPGLIGTDATLDAYALPVLRLAAFVFAATAIAWALRRRSTPLEAGFLGALIAVFPATLHTDLVPVCFGAAVLVLGVALVENAVRLAFDDGLTGLPARRALEENLAQLGGTYALAMVDIDHFKKLNDRHGHEVGDQVLRKVAARLARVRGGQAYRYGGEEFTLVFPGRSTTEAESAADDVRRAVADEPFTVRSPSRPQKKTQGRSKRGQGGGEKSVKVTVSAGVADRNDKRPTPDDVLKAADKALYRSKKAGRNRVTVAK